MIKFVTKHILKESLYFLVETSICFCGCQMIDIKQLNVNNEIMMAKTVWTANI